MSRGSFFLSVDRAVHTCLESSAVAERGKKAYNDKNKEILNEKSKVYYERNKESVKVKTAIYRLANQEAISERKKKQVVCECGCSIRKEDLSRHKKTNKHLQLMKLTMD